MYSQLQATEEQRADFKSGRNIMDKAVGYAKITFLILLLPVNMLQILVFVILKALKIEQICLIGK